MTQGPSFLRCPAQEAAVQRQESLAPATSGSCRCGDHIGAHDVDGKTAAELTLEPHSHDGRIVRPEDSFANVIIGDLRKRPMVQLAGRIEQHRLTVAPVDR